MAQPAQFDTNVQPTSGALNMPAPRAVENDSTSELIGQLGNVALNTADQVQRSAALGKQAVGLGNVASYSVQLGKVQQAVAQGVMSSTAARSRIRALRGQVISNNPSMLPQIDSATSSFLSDSGLGSDIVKGTDAEQQQAKITSQMAGEGWNITPDMSQGQQQDLIHAWQQQKQAQQQLQLSAQQIAVTRGKLGITSDQLGIQSKQQGLVTGAITQQSDQLALENKLHQTAANQAVFSGANAWTTNFSTKLDGIVKTFNNSAKSPADQQAAIDQVNLEMAQITANASKAGIGGDQSIIDQAIAPMKALASATTGFINGKIQTQGLADATQNAKNSAMLLAIHSADEKSRKILGIAMAAPGMSASLQTSLVDGAVLQMLGTNVQEPDSTGKTGGTDVALGRSDTNYDSLDKYLKGTTSTIQKSNLGTLDPNSEHMLSNSITNIANGLLNGNTKAKKPQDYNRIMQFFADPSVNAYMVAHPGTAALKGVSDLLAHEYTLNIMPLVQQEWKQATTPQGGLSMDNSITTSTPYGSVTVPGFKQVSRNQVVHVDFTGSGINFAANDPKDSQAQATADVLNQKVAPIMGTLIRAAATLNATNNYRKIWNENYASWFGAVPSPDPTPADSTPAPQAAVTASGQTMDKPTPQLMNSLFKAESGGNNNAVSPKGATGIGQMMPATADALGYSMDDLKDPETAKLASKQYMGMMLDRFDGKVKLALAAYNYGPTKVAKLVRKYGNDYASIEAHLPEETRNYVPKVLSGMSGG